ncbi:MAG TPA: polysaccharide pyruvyl transferase family protein [Candidatus Dormibacteraeota bacterium]|nr:polysaccharide pyruvyl transferase family protein [Candidatus Dormibacteraeota bacterium]
MVEADLVGDIRGGDSFSDIYGLKGFMAGFFPVWTVLLLKGSIVQFPQTFGPYKSPVARRLAQYILKRSSVIIARDIESQRVARELAGPNSRVLLSPDVAFSLEPFRPKTITTDRSFSIAPMTAIIGLNVNGLMYNSRFRGQNRFDLHLNYVSFLPRLVENLLDHHQGELWLIPHTFAPEGHVESDNEACERLRSALRPELLDRVKILTGEYDAQELKWIIGQCEFFVGSRMHSCIAALSQGVPCVGVAYSRKFQGVFECVGMQEWVIDARTVGEQDALARAQSLFKCRGQIKQELKTRANQARARLNVVFRDLIRRTVPAQSLEGARDHATQVAGIE